MRAVERRGFDVLSLANNHAGDYGKRRWSRPSRRVAGRRFVPFGAGVDLAAASRPAIVERNGVRFGVVGFNAIGETPRRPGRARGRCGCGCSRAPGRWCAPTSTGCCASSPAAQRVDVVLVLPHWGTQYTHAARPDQRLVGRALVRAGADVVIGGHPHWVQGMESVGDSVMPLAGQLRVRHGLLEQTQEGVVLELTFWGGELKALRLVPYVMGPDFAPGRVPRRRGRGDPRRRVVDERRTVRGR